MYNKINSGGSIQTKILLKNGRASTVVLRVTFDSTRSVKLAKLKQMFLLSRLHVFSVDESEHKRRASKESYSSIAIFMRI